jgi:hypothetical protein
VAAYQSALCSALSRQAAEKSRAEIFAVVARFTTSLTAIFDSKTAPFAAAHYFFKK